MMYNINNLRLRYINFLFIFYIHHKKESKSPSIVFAYFPPASNHIQTQIIYKLYNNFSKILVYVIGNLHNESYEFDRDFK